MSLPARTPSSKSKTRYWLSWRDRPDSSTGPRTFVWKRPPDKFGVLDDDDGDDGDDIDSGNEDDAEARTGLVDARLRVKRSWKDVEKCGSFSTFKNLVNSAGLHHGFSMLKHTDNYHRRHEDSQHSVVTPAASRSLSSDAVRDASQVRNSHDITLPEIRVGPSLTSSTPLRWSELLEECRQVSGNMDERLDAAVKEFEDDSVFLEDCRLQSPETARLLKKSDEKREETKRSSIGFLRQDPLQRQLKKAGEDLKDLTGGFLVDGPWSEGLDREEVLVELPYASDRQARWRSILNGLEGPEHEEGDEVRRDKETASKKRSHLTMSEPLSPPVSDPHGEDEVGRTRSQEWWLRRWID